MSAREAVRENRRVLRQVYDHFAHAHEKLNARREPHDFVDVVYHPATTHAGLNYVTPRRRTAWVPGAMVEQGLQRLRALDRVPRVQLIDGLYPQPFMLTLEKMGLVVERETPLLACTGVGDMSARQLPADAMLPAVDFQAGVDFWRALAEATTAPTFGVEPLLLSGAPDGGSVRYVDVLARAKGEAVGAARLSLQAESAHIVAVCVTAVPEVAKLRAALLAAAARTAWERGCAVVFAPGRGADDRDLLRAAGYREYGRVVIYRTGGTGSDGAGDDRLEQCLLSLD